MRLNLWQRLFLALAALNMAVLAGFVGWQQHVFRRGFLSYVNDAALARLAPAAYRLAAAYAEHGNWDFLRNDPHRLFDVIEPAPGERFRREADRPPRPARPPPPDGPPTQGLSPDDRPPPFDSHRPPPPFEPPDLRPRLALLDAAGQRVAGNPDVPPDAPALPIRLDGRAIGSLLLASSPHLSTAADLAFAQAQSRSAAIAGLATLFGSLLLALALARWLLAPIRALTTGARAMAAGDYARRIATSRSDEFGSLARDFDHLAATLEQARTARRQWGADIAHELRTPLAILSGEIQALQDGVRVMTPQALDSLSTECARLEHLIDDLYQLALADAGALDYRFESVDLVELVQEAVDVHRPACADAGLELETILPPTLPVRGDARRLGQLFDNLLTNARRYTDAPGRIRVTALASGTCARLLIEDTPPGVPPASLPQLFERLYRVDASRTRASGGAGLGLAICRAIVDAHGGRIEARSSGLGGLAVVVDLPAP